MSKRIQLFREFSSELEQVGLNLCAAFDLNRLPQAVAGWLPQNIHDLYQSLLLVGTKGGGFWQYLKSIDSTEGHCFDEVSLSHTRRALKEHYPKAAILALYPDDEYVIPLQQLGQLVGWGRPSILGLDINAEYGTWFAYRSAYLVSENLPPTAHQRVADVCETCVDKPCRTACPTGAVKAINQFDLPACIDHRIKENSSCSDRCLARLACPVGKDHMYQADQLAHHSRFSLASIKRYLENNNW